MNIDTLTVRHLMSSPVVTIHVDDLLPLARELLANARIRHLPVVDDNNAVVGLLSHRRIVTARAEVLTRTNDSDVIRDQLRIPVSEVMESPVVTTTEDTPMLEAAAALLRVEPGCLPVVEPATGELIGIVTEADYISLIARVFEHFAAVPVERFMTQDVLALSESQSLSLAEGLLALHRIRHLPVVDDEGSLVGMVTHRDLLEAQAGAVFDREEQELLMPVGKIMKRDVWNIAPDASALVAARMLDDHAFGCLPVVEGGKLVGIVSEADFVRVLVETLATPRVAPLSTQAPVNYFMSSPVHSVRADTELSEAATTMTSHRVGCVAVVDDDGRLVGSVARRDLLRYAGPLQTLRRGRTRPLPLPGGVVTVAMVESPPTVGVDSPIGSAAADVVRYGTRLFVVEDGRPIGLLSATDFFHVARELRIEEPISKYMTETLVSVDSRERLASALQLLSHAGVEALVVCDGAWVIGAFGGEQALASQNLADNVAVEAVMSARVISVPADMPLYQAARQAAELRPSLVVAVTDQPVGVLTGVDFAQACSDAHRGGG